MLHVQYEDFLLAVGDYYCNGTEIPPVALTPAEQADEEHDHGQGVNKRCGKGVGNVWGYWGDSMGLFAVAGHWQTSDFLTHCSTILLCPCT